MKSKTVCFSGHRTERLPKGTELIRLQSDLYAQVDKAVADGYETFLFGACHGFDILAAKQVLLRKQRGGDAEKIKLMAVVPFAGQENKWSEAMQLEYRNILAQSNKIYIMYTHYKWEHYLERNRFIVEQSSRLICYYSGGKGGTGYTVRYAKTKGVDIVNLYHV